MADFSVAMAILVATILIGFPISYSMGITGLCYILLTNPAYIIIIPNRLFAGVNQFQLMAIPFFILAANIMVKSDISKKLFDFARLFFGRAQGGLALVNVFGSMIFGSISGTALGDIAGLGAVEIDAMRRDGYDEDFACALTAASSLQSPLIPPSNIGVLYAGIMGLSVGALFLAGLVPGIVLGLSQIIYILIIRKKRNFPKDTKKYSREELVKILVDGLVTLGMPVIILTGILGGYFTPTESACVACLYSLFLGVVVYRNFGLRDWVVAVRETAITSANIFLVISFASVFAWIMGMEKISEQIAAMLLSISSDKYILFLLINIFLLIVGMWLDTGAAIILFAPILAPIMYAVGVEPIHFAIVMLVNLTLGLITPPVGVVLYAACSVGRCKFENVLRELSPFLLVSFVVLFAVTYIPEIVLFVPRLTGFMY